MLQNRFLLLSFRIKHFIKLNGEIGFKKSSLTHIYVAQTIGSIFGQSIDTPLTRLHPHCWLSRKHRSAFKLALVLGEHSRLSTHLSQVYGYFFGDKLCPVPECKVSGGQPQTGPSIRFQIQQSRGVLTRFTHVPCSFEN